MKTKIIKTIKIRRPDDLHVHFRDNDILKLVVPYTSRFFGRAIVMPNIEPPVININQAISYQKKICNAVPVEHKFMPLMTCYLTDNTNPKVVEEGFNCGVFIACKLYLANGTTNSKYGVSKISNIYTVFEKMEKLGIPLLVHGEVTNSKIDIFDREAYFIDLVMNPIRKKFPNLKIVFEHISTKEAVQYILSCKENLVATITPHHLLFNRNNMLSGSIKPHLYCSPILKSDIHQKALREAITMDCQLFFLGTDTAPHVQNNKESSRGCAGIFNAPTALAAYATVFDEMNAIENFEAFCSLNGAKFYGLPINEGFIELKRKKVFINEKISHNKINLIPFLANEFVDWEVNVV
ncbi:dihydroorotase [Arsenophonus endosymbiont of Lipoptena cervi]|uniref:dihydroorotase n=1 Tax=Arsenophonus endosymbiont of Lipoptena cervi TaxID=363258 RepID=UPI00376EC3CE